LVSSVINGIIELWMVSGSLKIPAMLYFLD